MTNTYVDKSYAYAVASLRHAELKLLDAAVMEQLLSAKSTEDAIKKGTDIISTTQIVEFNQYRLRVADTDKGKEIQAQIDDLQQLLYAYRHGFIKESERKTMNKL